MTKKQRYGKVDFSVLNNDELTAESLAIYACLTTFADCNREAFPSVDTLIKLSKLSKTRFYKNMKVLEKCGIVKKRWKKEGNLNRGIVYELQDFRVSRN